MNPSAMAPFGAALSARFRGEDDCRLIIRRDDGLETPLPAGFFLRVPADFGALESRALQLCRGHVLDIGAGSGLHTLALQSNGLEVTAIDVNSEAVGIMRRRGVRDARLVDVFDFAGGPFDTLLLLGHGIGMVENLPGLDRFFAHVRQLTAAGGRVLVHSLDPRQTDDPSHLAYHEANRKAGRYYGETRLQFAFRGVAGPFCGWLHVDPDTLAQHALGLGWTCDIAVTEESGDYLAVLSHRKDTPGGAA